MSGVPARLTAALADRYRLERELGQGGMATVFLAEDLRHHRKVAVKVLRPELAAILGAERFLAEIRTTANLQHPHILPLHDSGQVESTVFYVMPFVDGETLRDRLTRETQLPVEDAVRIATQVASALDYAHRQGVIHRDIKPENILLHDGSALVADFGIALAASSTGGGRMTETGMSLGTPHYMSPEQAMGEREISARSDVYALGCVLYEMLCGEPPFMGPTAQAIIARVVTETPRSLTSQRHTIPPQVEGAVLTALEKLPADRFATAAEFAAALASPTYASRATTSMAAAAPLRRSPRLMAAGWAVAVVAAAAALFGWLRPTPQLPVLRYAMALPEGQQLSNPRGTRIALSPDGRRLVYTGPGPEGSQLWIRNRDQFTAAPIPGTDGATIPFFSPDGQQVGFMTAGNAGIKVANLSGAPPILIADSGLGADGVTWAADGFIYFDGLTGGGTTGVVRVRATGGPVEQVTTVDTANGQVDHFWPQALPDGRGVLFTIQKRNAREASEVAVFDIKTGQYHTLVQGLTARYAKPGFLLYVTANGDLMTVPFDLKRLKVTGEAFALANGVAGRPFGAVDLTLSETGTLMYEIGTQVTAPSQLTYVSRDGTAAPIDSAWVGNFITLALSPDGTQLAVSLIEGTEHQVWIKQLPTGPLSKLTFEGTTNNRPTWTPDGKSVAYVSNVAGPDRLFVKRADGSGPAEQIPLPADRPTNLAAYSPDGQWLAYRTLPRDLFARRLVGDTATVPLVVTPFEEMDLALSPDGRWVAYTSDESGRFEVYVRPFPDSKSARWQVSTSGGSEPHWSHSGRELLFVAADGMLQSVEVIPGPVFTTGRRSALFSLFTFTGGIKSWDITPDDSQFVMIRSGVGGSEADELIVVENIFPDLRKKGAP